MLQVEHMPKRDEEVVVTPLVRLFKGTTLVELGVSDEGEALANWIVRF